MTKEPTLFDLDEIQAKTYHNTTNLAGKKLTRAESKQRGLKTAIENFFKQHPGYAYTCEDVHKTMNLPGVPIWSVRARISDLKKEGKLVKYPVRTLGSYGAEIGYYKLAEKSL